MKIIVQAFIFIFSSFAFSHSQSPIVMNKISLTGEKIVKIKIGNQNDKSSLFDIELNGEIIDRNFKIKGNGYRGYSTLITDIPESKLVKHKLCSIQVPDDGDNIRTRICTKIRIYYPKDKIKKITDE